MAMIGTIKEIATENGAIVATVETGAGPAVSAVCMFPSGMEAQPMRGDMVAFDRTGKDNVIFAVIRDTPAGAPGEVWIFGRDAAGQTVSEITLLNNGSVRIENDEGFVLLKASGQVSLNGNLTVDP